MQSGCKMLQEVVMEAVKLEGNYLLEYQNNELQQSKSLTARKNLEEQRSDRSIGKQVQYPLDGSSSPLASHLCPAPLTRQFWKAGAYNDGARTKVPTQGGKNYLHVHPMFLHSNATSHKWAFGAVAELLDNAVDEIQNGATFVIVDKIVNPRDQSVALLIQDDGGGMDPDALRRCMSFGFSDKSKGIGKYGNGFKTSTMRLGADVIVFSRCVNKSVVTQSIGLLSYTFLSRKGYDRIVVPMVDYESNPFTGAMEASGRYSKEHFISNLSLLLQWSPYWSEQDLLMQFDNIGSHGTKVIIYNLWFNEDGKEELDFDSDPEDIHINGDKRKIDTIPAWKSANEQHIANRLHHSLRVYLSILYLRIPENFRIVLRGRVVEHHNIADDLKFIEYILYKPQTVGFLEGQVVTTIGFLKEAPQMNIHGFNVYHKNRLILPFWQVVSYADSRGRGVVGVLEANFVEPVHNKQDFERTSLFQKLEVRLKEMTWEYWDYHCGLLGYQVKKKPKTQPVASLGDSFDSLKWRRKPQSNPTDPPVSSTNTLAPPGFPEKRKAFHISEVYSTVKRQATELNHEIQPVKLPMNQSRDPEESANLMQEKLKLQAKCLEYETIEKQLTEKLSGLMNELEDAQSLYTRLLAEAEALDQMKEKKGNYSVEIL